MIQSPPKLKIRAITEQDRQGLANLVHFERYIHRHLDWRAPLDWIGGSSFDVAENNGKLVAALASPPDPPGVAWIRLFAVLSDFSISTAWNELWTSVSAQLVEIDRNLIVAAIPLSKWFRSTLESSGFFQVDQVVVLLWETSQILPENRASQFMIRIMKPEDLEAVELVDHAAFIPLWQFSPSGLEAGFQESAFATVVENSDGIIAYQISTSTSFGGHLARLAVHPHYQNRGIGYALLQDVLKEFQRRGARNVTVNTQLSNISSLALYAKARFRRTGEEYPVYQYRFGFP